MTGEVLGGSLVKTNSSWSDCPVHITNSHERSESGGSKVSCSIFQEDSLVYVLGSKSFLVVIIQFLVVSIEERWRKEVLLAWSHFNNVRLSELPEIVLKAGSHQVVALLVFYVKLFAYNLAYKCSDFPYSGPLLRVVGLINNVICHWPYILP